MFKRLCAKIVQLGEQMQKERYANEVRPATNMERMFGDCSPAVVAFKIDNGYVVRTIQTGPQYLEGSTASGFTYCKDHQAIADHIVSEAAREVISPKQQQMKYGAIANAHISNQAVPAPRR
jgi:tRNA A-37 threonylcarbamoyl transferase component Bud32